MMADMVIILLKRFHRFSGFPTFFRDAKDSFEGLSGVTLSSFMGGPLGSLGLIIPRAKET